MSNMYPKKTDTNLRMRMLLQAHIVMFVADLERIVNPGVSRGVGGLKFGSAGGLAARTGAFGFLFV